MYQNIETDHLMIPQNELLILMLGTPGLNSESAQSI